MFPRKNYNSNGEINERTKSDHSCTSTPDRTKKEHKPDNNTSMNDTKTNTENKEQLISTTQNENMKYSSLNVNKDHCHSEIQYKDTNDQKINHKTEYDRSGKQNKEKIEAENGHNTEYERSENQNTRQDGKEENHFHRMRQKNNHFSPPIHRIKRFFLSDAVDMVGLCTRSINSDSFTKCFEPISVLEMHHSGILYIFSLFIRYFILLPIRIIFFCIGTILFAISFLVGYFMQKEKILEKSFFFYCNVFCWSFGAKINNHGNKRSLKNVPHIFIANHTSFLDFIVLSSHKFCHASVSENHGGLFGFFLKKILSKNGSLYFKRSEKTDKQLVLKRIEEHMKLKKTPMLLFPEGTCVNNKYTIMFQKGVFELNPTICPVAIKYKRKLFDPYWNRRKHTFTEHILYLMSRWMIEVDVYWLDPMKKFKNENTHDFINRVKQAISEKAGLQSIKWNGYMKNQIIIKDIDILRQAYRDVYLDIFYQRRRQALIQQNERRNRYDTVFNQNGNSSERPQKDDNLSDNMNNQKQFFRSNSNSKKGNFSDRNSYNSIHYQNAFSYLNYNKNIKKRAIKGEIQQTHDQYGKNRIGNPQLVGGEPVQCRSSHKIKYELRVSDSLEVHYFDSIGYSTFIKKVLSKYCNIKFRGGRSGPIDAFFIKQTKVKCSCSQGNEKKKVIFSSGMCGKEIGKN